MSSITPNLGLIKPTDIEDADINTINDNMDVIDSAFLDKIYPVGSIYMSVNSVSPSSFIGGTWERITGSFLLAATDNGSSGAEQEAGNTGGAAKVALGTDELPSHKHTVGAHSHGLNSHKHTVPAHGHGNNINFSVNNSGYIASGISGGTHIHGFSGGALRPAWYSGDQQDWQVSYVANANNDKFVELNRSSHNHDLPNHTHTLSKSGGVYDSPAFDTGAASGSTANSTAFDSGATGANKAHENMPPFLSVYMWKRVA